jgi:predicted secreted protein
MSYTGLAIIYIIIWWVVFFATLPIDVNRQKPVKIEGEDPGSPENPKMLKKVYLLHRNNHYYFYYYLFINEI